MSESRPVLLITGGARRVGAAIARTFARAGYDVAFTFRRSHEQAMALEYEISQVTRALSIAADFDRVDFAIDLVRRKFAPWSERLDVLVNNASVFAIDAKLSVEAATRVNASAPCGLIDAFAPQLRASRGGVVNMLDLLAERPAGRFGNYAASKAALASATRTYAKRFASDGVRVNGIAPGVIEWAADTSEEDRAKYLKNVPLARSGTPQEAADLALFLSRDATYMTGQIVRLDGGRSLTLGV